MNKNTENTMDQNATLFSIAMFDISSSKSIFSDRWLLYTNTPTTITMMIGEIITNFFITF